MKQKNNASAAIVLIVAAAFLIISVPYISRERSGKNEYTKLDEVMAAIEQYYVGEYTREELEEYAAAAMVDALGDRWSYYMTAETLEAYMQDSNNEYYGIGTVIEQSGESIIISSVYADSPAAAVGLRPGGELRQVDGEDVAGLGSTEAKAMVQTSLEDGQVSLTVLQNGEIKEYTVAGGLISVDPVRYELLDGVGYIKISNFDAKSSEQLIDACEKLLEQGAEGLVFDVRFNPGGQLDELLAALDHLLPEGDIFLSRTRNGAMEAERSDADCLELPMAVLVNGESYSAAEFFAAALQEYEWALVVGEQTSGKGYAQTTLRLSDGSAVHISIKEYFTPNGVSLANVGVTPDEIVEIEYDAWAELYYDDLEPAADPQLQAALAGVKAEITK